MQHLENQKLSSIHVNEIQNSNKQQIFRKNSNMPKNHIKPNMNLEDCLEEIEGMQQKIRELECQLQVQRMKEDDRRSDLDQISGCDCGNGGLDGYEKVVASRKNPSGTTTEIFALKKTIPAIVSPSASKTSQNKPDLCSMPKKERSDVSPKRNRDQCALHKRADDKCSPAQQPISPKDNCGEQSIFMKRTHETAIYRPNQKPTKTSTSCSSADVGRTPSSTSLEGNNPCAALAKQIEPKKHKPCPTASKNSKNSPTVGKITGDEKNANPFDLLNSLIENSSQDPKKCHCTNITKEQPKTEEEEKLQDVVNFINCDIFPILIEAVKGIIERVDESDVCLCLENNMENESAFAASMRHYRNVSKSINCFMQDILKRLSKKLAERSKKYSPQMELMLQGKGVIEQAEIALSEDLGRVYGREENDDC